MPFEQVPASPFEFPLVGEFSAATTCLLVIDLQRDFTEEGGYMTAMGYDITPCAAPLKPVAAVLAACRKAGMHVIHTRQGCAPAGPQTPNASETPSLTCCCRRSVRQDLADLTPYLVEKFKRSGVTIGADGPLGRIFVRGEAGWEINPAVAPADGEPIIDKTANSAFIGTDLDVVLRGKGIDKLMCAGDRGSNLSPVHRRKTGAGPLHITRPRLTRPGGPCRGSVCGNTLDCCVHCTLRHANDLNYQTLLLSDCCGCVEAEVGGGRTRAFLAPCLTPGPLATRRCPGCARR